MSDERLFYNIKNTSGLAKSLAEQVSREIGKNVVSGLYQPSSLIEDEGSLATKYNVSRSVIRDAAKILVGKGLIEVRRGIGTTVLPRSRWSLLDDDILAWHLSAPLNKHLIKQLLEIRLTIEPTAVKWAVERGTVKEIDEIKTSYEKMEEHIDSVDNYVTADALFHKSILTASHNEFLFAFEGVIYSSLLLSIRATNRDPKSNKKSIPFHTKILQSIIDKDSLNAEKNMRIHLEDTERRLKGLFKNKKEIIFE